MRQQKNISILCHVPKKITSVALIYFNAYKNNNILKRLEKWLYTSNKDVLFYYDSLTV